MPFGAEVLADGRTRFRLWAPAAEHVELRLAHEGGETALDMASGADGWFECTAQAPPGTRYRYRLPGGQCVPDPASRFNPDDVHGESEVVDALRYAWRDGAWRGRPWHEAVLYEVHVGTYTPAGTFAALERRLDDIAALGVTAIELMPLADFPGARSWGYDGVLPYAPDAAYGAPDDLKRLVDAAHARGLMVFVDVVYNHFGPEGNYLGLYAPQFFTAAHHTPWGAAINYDRESSRAVREFFIHNALYWIEEFHADGLRLDAVHAIMDDSARHVLVELAERVRSGPGRARHVHLVLENDANCARLLARDEGRARWYDAQWNDDFHHVFHVLLTGERDGYYADYADGATGHLARCLAEGYAYQGEPSAHRAGRPRGEPSGALPPTAFVSFLQNHDQVGNRALGERIGRLADPAALRAAVCAWLLAPQIPLLFMGEEFDAPSPSQFFCDFHGDLARAVREGRRAEFAAFSGFGGEEGREAVPDPGAVETFECSKLDWTMAARSGHREWRDLYVKLLALRRQHLMPRLARVGPHAGRAEVHGEGAATVRWALDGAALELRLNLSAREMQGLPAPEGGALHVEPPGSAAAFSAGVLPAHAAAVYLRAERCP